ncbi:E4 orf2 [Simian adenovirus A1327]|uniref:E4 orf2 n=2 Tax=Simian mastadenovirus B TaxID=1962299 RepID=H9AB15_9ADEN|nr:E4 orf2 [Simian adenovirus A1327]AFD22159.1 E4 orf2 [Simian adenovirus A1335]
MYERRPVFFSVCLPQPLVDHLHACSVEVYELMLRVLPEFWRQMLLYLTPPFESASAGATLLSLSPSFQVLCCVMAPELTPNSELASATAFDLFEVLRLALMYEIREHGHVPNPELLNLLQVSQEVNFF